MGDVTQLPPSENEIRKAALLAEFYAAHPRNPGRSESAEELDKLLGYSGSIQGTPLEQALDEQRQAIFDIQAILEVAAIALYELKDSESMPAYPRMLRNAAKQLDDIAAALDGGTLEDRAIEIAKKAGVSEATTAEQPS